MAVRHIGLLFSTLFVFGLGLGTGCTRFAAIEVIPSDCVNPASGNCPSSGALQESRVMDLRIYQLKDKVPECKLDYAVFSEDKDKDLDLLKAQLVDTQRKDLMRRVELIEATKSKPIANLLILPTTKYILAVAVGRQRGKNSIRLIPRTRAIRRMTLYIRGTDLCLDSNCESSAEAQCP